MVRIKCCIHCGENRQRLLLKAKTMRKGSKGKVCNSCAFLEEHQDDYDNSILIEDAPNDSSFTTEKSETKQEKCANVGEDGQQEEQSLSAGKEERKEESPFSRFLKEGNAGYQIFQMKGGIRSFLNVEDLVRCSSSGVPVLMDLCRTFTLSEVLAKKTKILPSLDHTNRLDIKVYRGVKTYLNKQWEEKYNDYDELYFNEYRICVGGRPQTLHQPTPGHRHYSDAYHPDELDDMNIIIDQDLNDDGIDRSELPHFVSAHFGDKSVHLTSRKDISDKVLPIVKDNELIIDTCRIEKGSYYQKIYKRLFGDPCHGKVKKLTITLRNPVTGEYTYHDFKENRRVHLLMQCDDDQL